MTIICSWCRDVMSEDETEQGEIVSHSICDVCTEKLKNGDFEGVDFPDPEPDPRNKTD